MTTDKSVSLTQVQAEKTWDALFHGRTIIEDLIALEQAGIPSGYKPGILKGYLKDILKAQKLMGVEG